MDEGKISAGQRALIAVQSRLIDPDTLDISWIPSSGQVYAHLKKVLAASPEPPPLSRAGIGGALFYWGLLVTSYLGLLAYIASIPGVREAFTGLTGGS